MHSHCCFSRMVLYCTRIATVHSYYCCTLLLLLCSHFPPVFTAVHSLLLCTRCCCSLVAPVHSLLRYTHCCGALFAAVHSLLLCTQFCRALVLQSTQFAYVRSYCLYALILLRCTVHTVAVEHAGFMSPANVFYSAVMYTNPYIHSDCTRTPFLGTSACTYTEDPSAATLCLCVHMHMHRGFPWAHSPSVPVSYFALGE